MKPKCVTILNIITDKTTFNHHEFEVDRGTLTGVCRNCGLVLIADEEYWDKMQKNMRWKDG